MDDSTKKKALARLHRISGQVEGIARMIDGDRQCVDILLQIASAQAALGQAAKVVLRSHVVVSVTDATKIGRPAERVRKVEEIMDLFARTGCFRGKV